MEQICTNSQSGSFVKQVMYECADVATRLGVTFRIPIEQRISGAASFGKHKTSMCQDVESGNETEVDALVGAVIELGQLTKTPTPRLETLYVCVKLLSDVLTKENGCSIVVPISNNKE
jgi:2-dehydropantoate 2-reductase